jgi:hypothetical protein
MLKYAVGNLPFWIVSMLATMVPAYGVVAPALLLAHDPNLYAACVQASLPPVHPRAPPSSTYPPLGALSGGAAPATPRSRSACGKHPSPTSFPFSAARTKRALCPPRRW